MRRVSLSLLAIFLAISFCYSQNIAPFAFNTAGGYYGQPGSYHRYEWSFGELVLIAALASPDSSILVTHGVLQPCTEKTTNSPMVVYFLNNEYSVFPNPTKDKFEVNFFVKENGRMDLKLMDATGKILEQRTYQYNGCCRIETFDLSRYADGLYWIAANLKPNEKREDGIYVIRNSGFKIIKITK